MYSFENHLHPGEEILYQGKGVPGKGGKEYGGIFFLLGFSVLAQALMLWALHNSIGDGVYGITLSFITLFAVCVLFAVLAIYNLINVLFLQDRYAANCSYCLTSERAMVYDARKQKLIWGYLRDFETIATSHIKGKYGNLNMSIPLVDSSDQLSLSNLQRLYFQRDPENMPSIAFKCIQDPQKVQTLAQEARSRC